MSIVEELEAAGEILSPLVRAVLLRQEHRIAELEREVAELRARPGMNSRNSSKPLAADLPGAPRRGLWRKTSFGSDSAGGVRFVERVLSVAETCRPQRRSAFDYLRDAILARRCSSADAQHSRRGLSFRDLMKPGSILWNPLRTRQGPVVGPPAAGEGWMSGIVYLNGDDLSRAEARIPVDDRGFVLGDGVYEVTGVLPIVRLDGGTVGDGRPGRVTRALQAAYAARIGPRALVVQVHG